MSFRTARKFMGPSWLVSEGESGLVGYALDTIKDAFIRRLELGALARFPTTAPDDALPFMGRDRRVVRGINESRETYVQRLIRWLDDRRTQGNPFALMRTLAAYTGPGPSFRTVDARGNWFSRAADGTETYLLDQGNWNWDGIDPAKWSRYWVIIYPNGLWTDAAIADHDDLSSLGQEWGEPQTQAWGEDRGWTWGSTAAPDQVDTIRSIVADWKPAGTRCVKIILALDPASFNPASPEPDGTWRYDGKNVAGVRVPARLSTARYWDGP